MSESPDIQAPELELEGENSDITIAAQNSEETSSKIIESPSPAMSQVEGSKPTSRRWLTLEFGIYYAIVAFSYYKAFRAIFEFSSPSSPNYHIFEHELGPGWMFGRLVDLSDLQFRSFRQRIPLLTIAMLGFVFTSRALTYVMRTRLQKSTMTELYIRSVCSIAILFVLHGCNALKEIALLLLLFSVGRLCGKHWLNPLLTWGLAIGSLFLLEYCDLVFGKWLSILGFLDAWNGMYPRWNIVFNITMLRMISYNMDYYFSMDYAPAILEKVHKTCVECDRGESCDRVRTVTPADPRFFNIAAYFTYVLYLPLYFAGPIITFNDYMSQLERPLQSITFKSTALYGVRVLFSMLVLEWMLHFCYLTAVAENDAWIGFTPLQIISLGWFILYIIWLKLMIIWRFFRFWALADGIEPCENMIRCMSNNLSCAGFWRSWHRSYNQWIIRYIYIPLGGKRRSLFNIWIIFTFVAIWHDIKLHLLVWGWLIALGMAPELIFAHLSMRFQWERLPAYRYLAAFGYAANMFIMMIANLVGFAVGTRGILELVSGIIAARDVWFVFATYMTAFALANISLEVRAEELRHGINKNC